MSEQPNLVLHGVFIEVSGFGVLLRGNSAIGKSEMALSLINRGHRLVADDAVEIKLVAPDTLIGSCPPLLQDFLEVRGLGILNIRILFGDKAIKDSKRLQLIVHMATFQEHELQQIDRLHGMYRMETILGTSIPEVTIPVAPGRNLAILIETAVRNQVLKHNGYDAPHEFILKQQQSLRDNIIK